MSELGVNVLHDECYCFTLHSLFYVCLDHCVICYDVVAEALCLQALLSTFLTSWWSHHASFLAHFAERVLRVVTKLVVRRLCFCFQVCRLSRPNVFGFLISSNALVNAFWLFWIGGTTGHCKKLSQLAVLFELLPTDHFARRINHRNPSIYLQLNDFVIRPDEVRSAISWPDKTITLLHASNTY